MCEIPRLEGELDVAVAVRADQIVRGSIGGRRRGPPMDPCWAASALAVREAAGENRRIEDRTPAPSGHRPKRRNRRERQLERDRGAGQVSPRSDLYALGAVVWHIATGRTPTVDPLSGRIVPPQGLDPTLSAFIVAVTANAPADRPRSAAEAREILARPAPVPMSAPPRPASPPAKVPRPEGDGSRPYPPKPPSPRRPLPWQSLPPAPRAVTGVWQDFVASLAFKDANDVVHVRYAALAALLLAIFLGVMAQNETRVLAMLMMVSGGALLIGAMTIESLRNDRMNRRMRALIANPIEGRRTRTFVEGHPVLLPVVDWLPHRETAGKGGTGDLAFAVPAAESNKHLLLRARVTTEFGEACKARGTVPVLMRPGALDAIIVMEP